MIKAVIFDFDGVIHDTFDFNLKWLNHFVNDNFKPLTNQEFRDLHNGNSYNLRIKNPKLKDINYVEYRKVTAKARGEFQIEPQIFKEIKNLEEKFQLFIVSSAGEQ
jgi:beta-phosphoglucomutase-like phosphatase (HAD superfamily)